MNWRIGLGLIFLLVLLFAVLHMAVYVTPSTHALQFNDAEIPSAPALTPIPNQWRTVQSGEEVRIYPKGMQFDASGNVLYPHGSISYH